MPSPDAKQAIRVQVWNALEAASATHTPVHGRIPTFKGAEAAAELLAAHPAYQRARVIKAVPDWAQHPVRTRALADGKTVYMAVPKLATPKPFRHLDPTQLPLPPHEAATSSTAVRIGRPVDVDEMPPIDAVVLGSVAVNRNGARIGKGAGYSDLEWALLSEAGLVTPHTLVVTTVHALQVIDDPIPTSAHDLHVDLIVTPTQTLTCDGPPRPTGIHWELLTAGQIEAIPALRERASKRPGIRRSPRRRSAG